MKPSIIETHPEIAAQWHPTLNGDLLPSDFTHGSSIKIWWKCSIAEDHEWEVSISNRTNNTGSPRGCPCCRGLKVVLSNCLATIYPEMAKLWHPVKNGTLTARDVTYGSGKKVWWKCPVAIDHEWETAINCKKGCPCCLGQKVVLSNCLATTHPKIAAQWHPTKNDNTTPFDVVSGSNKYFWWYCNKCQHSWEAVVNSRTGSGCPKCQESKGEKIISLCLSQLGVSYDKQHRFLSCKNRRQLPFDFFIENHNKVIEYQGEQHYEPVLFGGCNNDVAIKRFKKTKINDSIKRKWCQDNNVPLLEIPYWEFNNISTLVEQFIS